MTTLQKIATKIIEEQELVIGPLAWGEAEKVQGLKVTNHEVDFNNGDPKSVVDRLVGQYERLFGRASHEVCREAVADLLADLPQGDIPLSLQS